MAVAEEKVARTVSLSKEVQQVLAFHQAELRSLGVLTSVPEIVRAAVLMFLRQEPEAQRAALYAADENEDKLLVDVLAILGKTEKGRRRSARGPEAKASGNQ